MYVAHIAVLVCSAWLLSVPAFTQAPGTASAALKDKGVQLMEQGSIQEAVTTFRQALKAAPRDTELLNDLGVALRKDGDLTGSLEALEKAVKLRQDDARIHSNIALTLSAMGRVNQAVAAIETASRLSPADTVVRRADAGQ